MEIFFVICSLAAGIGSFLFSLFGANRFIRNLAAVTVGLHIFIICFHINNYVQKAEPVSVQIRFAETVGYLGGLSQRQSLGHPVRYYGTKSIAPSRCRPPALYYDTTQQAYLSCEKENEWHFINSNN